jgi:hypothetical protein
VFEFLAQCVYAKAVVFIVIFTTTPINTSSSFTITGTCVVAARGLEFWEFWLCKIKHLIHVMSSNHGDCIERPTLRHVCNYNIFRFFALLQFSLTFMRFLLLNLFRKEHNSWHKLIKRKILREMARCDDNIRLREECERLYTTRRHGGARSKSLVRVSLRVWKSTASQTNVSNMWWIKAWNWLKWNILICYSHNKAKLGQSWWWRTLYTRVLSQFDLSTTYTYIRQSNPTLNERYWEKFISKAICTV